MGELINLPYKAIAYEEDGEYYFAVYHPKTLRILEGQAKYVGCHIKELNTDHQIHPSDIHDFVAHTGERVWEPTN